MRDAPPSPFVPRLNRSLVTGEPDTGGRWGPLYPEMMGFANQGGGALPADFTWASNPKQTQEELTEVKLRAQLSRGHALPSGE